MMMDGKGIVLAAVRRVAHLPVRDPVREEVLERASDWYCAATKQEKREAEAALRKFVEGQIKC